MEKSKRKNVLRESKLPNQSYFSETASTYGSYIAIIVTPLKYLLKMFLKNEIPTAQNKIKEIKKKIENYIIIKNFYISSTLGWNILLRNPMEGDLYG